jgi:hypothetical protein
MIAILDGFCRLMFLMAAGHALADRPLQEGAIRSDKYAPRGVVGDHRWLYGLACHGLIHGGIVALVTGSWKLGVAETIAHALIDDQKMRGRYGQLADQILHMICKLAWAAIAISSS